MSIETKLTDYVVPLYGLHQYIRRNDHENGLGLLPEFNPVESERKATMPDLVKHYSLLGTHMIYMSSTVVAGIIYGLEHLAK